MRRVYWHLMRRFYKARSVRAFCNHLKFEDRSVKFSSLIENYEAHHKSPEPRERRLPSSWWLLAAAALVYALASWAIFA